MGNRNCIAIFVYCLLFLSSCTNNTQQIITEAQAAGFVQNRYPTQSFLLTTYEHLPRTSTSTTSEHFPRTSTSTTRTSTSIARTSTNTIYVYIEGDGNSWKSKYRLSNNPTPKQPLALTLAQLDPHSHVIYLARPCQYTPHHLDPLCQPKYWSSHRYAPEVIQANNEVLDQLKQKLHNTHFVLIGFSGGASVATLLAAQRQDIAGLITVAGDLNHDALNQYHHTSPLVGSLNPTKVAPKLKQIVQHHYSGSHDKIVPPWIAADFAKAVDNPTNVHVYELKKVSHHKGWEEHWPEILKVADLSFSL